MNANYITKRKSDKSESLSYYLNKYRDEFARDENTKRKELKGELKC